MSQDEEATKNGLAEIERLNVALAAMQSQINTALEYTRELEAELFKLRPFEFDVREPTHRAACISIQILRGGQPVGDVVAADPLTQRLLRYRRDPEHPERFVIPIETWIDTEPFVLTQPGKKARRSGRL